jgi:predicted Zn-dependent protease
VTRSGPAELADALDGQRYDEVLHQTDAILAETPGNDAAHEYRARALLALGRVDEAEVHAQDAVRLDPEEIRYRELLAEILSREGAHRDAAVEFGRLARNDPRESTWTVAEARERLGAAQPGMGVEAARRAVHLDPRDGRAQLALAQGLTRTGDARGAFQAASMAAELLPGDPEAREALADAQWLAGQEAAAFEEFRSLASGLRGSDRDRVVTKARSLYRRQAGFLGRLVAGIGPLFDLAFGNGWLRISR